MIRCDAVTYEDVEQWRPVLGWEHLYEVSSLGKVRSCARSKTRANGAIYNYPSIVLTPSISIDGYLRVKLCEKPRRKDTTCAVHRLVAASFVDGASDEVDTVNHIDGNKRNNSPGNLEWISRGRNSQHGWQSGLMTASASGQSHVNAKLTNIQAASIVVADCSKRGAIAALSKQYGVSVRTICNIRKGKRYANV